MKSRRPQKHLALAILDQETPITNFLTASGTFQDGDLLLNQKGLRLISEERGGANQVSESKASAAAKPPAKAQVVGWPPVRSFQKNALKSCTYVKVAIDGAPYLRKVDLEMYGGYQQLLNALEEMFSCFTIQ